MFIKYQIVSFSENRIVDTTNFNEYDDYTAIHKASRLFNSGYFDVVALTKGAATVKVFNNNKRRNK